MTERQIAFDSPVYCMTDFICPSFLRRETSECAVWFVIFRKIASTGSLWRGWRIEKWN